MRPDISTGFVSPQTPATAMQIGKVALGSALAGLAIRLLSETNRTPMPIVMGVGIGAIIGPCLAMQLYSTAEKPPRNATIMKASDRALHVSPIIGMLSTTAGMFSARILAEKVWSQL